MFPVHRLIKKVFSRNLFVTESLAILLAILVGAGIFSPDLSVACPDRHGLVDWNCDGKITITAFGDSITVGAGDRHGGGYPARLERLIPGLVVVNAGVRGEQTSAGLRRAKGVFSRHSTSDFNIILEGVNDFKNPRRSPAKTVSNILKMRRFAKSFGAAPVIARLTPVRRPKERTWSNTLNSSLKGIAEINFTAIGVKLIGSDALHPTGAGYQRMAEIALQSLRVISRKRRPIDSDQDGIYDFAEARFGANPMLADTDGDGLLDGAEVFTHGTRPDNADTDGDGFSDSYEIETLRSDPTDPADPVVVIPEDR